MVRYIKFGIVVKIPLYKKWTALDFKEVAYSYAEYQADYVNHFEDLYYHIEADLH